MSATTALHAAATTAVEPITASGAGDLDGHAVTCSACGYRQSTSLSAQQALRLGREHIEYMARNGR